MGHAVQSFGYKALLIVLQDLFVRKYLTGIL